MADIPTPLQQARAWFNPVMYERAASFTRQQWIEQIAKRAVIQTAIENRDQALLGELMPGLIDAPLADYPFKYSNTSLVTNNLSNAGGAVIPLGFSDLDRLQRLRQDWPSAGDDAIDEWALQHEDLLSLSPFGHVKVDLNARDADILAGFKRWLESRRLVFREPPEHYRKNIDELIAGWHHSNVLPYFDLMAWEAWSGSQLTESNMIELLFQGDSSASRDRLRRSLRNARQALIIGNAMALSMVARD